MTFSRLRNRIILTPGLAALAVLCGATDALAQRKGTAPPPAPGTIYFNNSGGAGPDWRMNGDGTGKALTVGGQPSSRPHGGARWFLRYDWGPGDWAGDWGQWFAADETGRSVRLTGDADLHWNGVPPSWARDDSFFSFGGVYETDTEWVGRLFVVEVAWVDGVPVAGPPTVALEVRRPLWTEELGDGGYDEVNPWRHDWSPAGDEVALTRWVWGEGWVIDVARFSEGGVDVRRLAAQAANPEWSPGGGRIAFNREVRSGYQDVQDVRTIRPDGTDLVRLTAYASGKTGGRGQSHPTWSPDGAYLAYTERVTSGTKTAYNVLRIPAAGGGPVGLTSDGVSSRPRWRP